MIKKTKYIKGFCNKFNEIYGMKIITYSAYRTTMPFDNRSDGQSATLSPPSSKSVMPFNNVHTIQDALTNNWPHYKDLHGGGDWTPGEDAQGKSYKPKGDDYKRQERDLSIINKMLDLSGTETGETWKVRLPGGSRVFPSFNAAQRYKEKYTVYAHGEVPGDCTGHRL